MSPVRAWTMPQQWLGTAHHIVGNAERVHDVERQKRDVRRLEHVAAGVEHEVRALAWLGRRAAVQPLADALAEPRDIGVVELHARQHVGAVGDQAEILDALLAPLARLVLLSRHGHARHCQRKRGLTPSGHASMQSPVSAQPLAQAFAAAGPSPLRTISKMPAITALGAASPTPAGPVTGQISTHLPHCVQASSMSAVRAAKADSNAVSVM